jgi:hypothetical protein
VLFFLDLLVGRVWQHVLHVALPGMERQGAEASLHAEKLEVLEWLRGLVL